MFSYIKSVLFGDETQSSHLNMKASHNRT